MGEASIFLPLLAISAGSDSGEYQKGTIKKTSAAEPGSPAQVYYALQTEHRLYELKICGSFEDGSSVDFRLKGNTVFIRGGDGNDIKCPIQLVSGAAKPVTYSKGTIEGFEKTLGNDTHNLRRQSKVYTLRGPDMLYLVDFCGAFQSGAFTTGQVVDFRVDGERLFILHDGDKEYSCKLEGTHTR